MVKCDCTNGFDRICEEAAAEAAEEIAAGNLVVYPTETVYGIGADVFNEVAVKNLYMAKNRPFDMALSVAVSDKNMMESIAVLDENADKLIKAFLPGPLTIIIEKKPEIPDMVTAMSKKVGIRMPDHPVAMEIVKRSGPIIATSANLHSHPDATDIDSAVRDLGQTVSLYVDSGPSKLKKPSTIVWIMNGEVEIVRQGAISVKDIEEIINA
ncbi:MAG: threonylcarbamoyl-AMP synthase [Candidatus Methanoplasma sp.]|jgi:L-threonylcarbamoyladenylate synthase|nr:threonylcarbamoyl-AMP synthase [Candidatus Methanoplasma sp.]